MKYLLGYVTLVIFALLMIAIGFDIFLAITVGTLFLLLELVFWDKWLEIIKTKK